MEVENGLKTRISARSRLFARPAPRARLAGGEIVLIAGDVADLEWEPTYPQPFLRWELYRGVDAANLARIRQGADQTTDHYRDSGLTPGVHYHYRLDAIYCVGDCSGPEDERAQVVFRDDVTAGRFDGRVRHDLTLAAKPYEIGSVYVESGATLVAGPGTTIRRPGTSSAIYALEGRLEIDGATLDHVRIDFGTYGDDDAWGQGWVRDATFVDAGISVLGQSDVLIAKNKGLDHISVYGQSQAVIRDNEIAGSVEIHQSARATISNNTIGNGDILVDGSRARATIRENTLTLAYPNRGIKIWDGYGHVADNTATFTGFHGSESTLLVSVMGAETAATIERNSLSHGKIGINWGSTVTVTDNVLTGGGAAISVGCVVCGSQIQARGTIARNTVRDGWGFEMWAGSHAIPVHFNCIQGNDPGMTLDDVFLEDAVNAPFNWWGAASGPTYPSNPGGSGDRIEGSKVSFLPVDTQPTYCRDTPPPPPQPAPAAIGLKAEPDAVTPDGEEQANIRAEVRDDAGEPVAGADVLFGIVPDAYGEQLGHLVSQTCTTDSDGRCRVVYVAPTAAEVFRHGSGAEEVTVEAEVVPGETRFLGPTAPAGLTEKTTIAFKYLKVMQTSPAHAARNVDWTHSGPWAIFDRELDPESIHETNFQVTSSLYYRNGLPCTMDTGHATRAYCQFDLSDLTQHPHADDGLIITAELKAGPNGIRGADGALLRADYVWKYFTTPVLAPRIIAAQGGESTDLLAGRPGLFRVEAGLSETTELDYVEAEVYLSYGAAGAFTRPVHLFYPDPLTGPLMVQQTGNSANFYSRDHQVPILVDGRGTRTVEARLTPIDQQAIVIPHEYGTVTTVKMHIARDAYFPFYAAIFPIVPRGVYCMDGYTWQAGQPMAGLGQQPVVQEAATAVGRMFPLRAPLDIRSSVQPIHAHVSSWVAIRGCKVMLPGLLRVNGYWSTPSTDAVLMLVPGPWIRGLNGGDPIFHQSQSEHCIAGDDAPGATLAHCVGHIYGLGDDADGPVRGYDLERDRYVNGDEPVIGYTIPLMDRNLARLAAGGSDRVWLGVNTYSRLMQSFSAATASASLTAPAATMAVGGMLLQEAGTVGGVLDLIDWPATNDKAPAPEGTGAYALRLRDATGAVLATHVFAPVFAPLADGTPYASFLYTIPAPEGTSTVDLLHGSELLDTIGNSQHAPSVSIRQPSGGSHSGPLALAWQGEDDDGDALLYHLYLSADDGATWMPVALGVTGSDLTVDSTAYANGARCRLKVVAHDGFHSATAVSAPFAIANPPRADWLWPADGCSSAPPYPEIIAAFRDPMAANTIHSGSFTLVDGTGNPVAGSVRYEIGARQAIFTPAGALTYGRDYTARLAATIQGEDGQSLGTAVSWSFRVEAGPFVQALPLVSK